MNTQTTNDSIRTPEGVFHGFRLWRHLVLVALLPMAVACTETVTGPERASQDTEARVDGGSGPASDEIPVAR